MLVLEDEETGSPPIDVEDENEVVVAACEPTKIPATNPGPALEVVNWRLPALK